MILEFLGRPGKAFTLIYQPATEVKQTIDLFQVGSPQLAHFRLSLKPSIILIRWPVVIICSYLFLNPSTKYLPESFFQGFIVLYVLSNVALYFLDEHWFASWSFYYPLVIADTIVLTLSVIINGRADTEFYFAFFLLIMVSCIFEDAKLRAGLSFAAPLVYAGLLFRSGQPLDTGVYLRFPFLFVVAFYYGYFTQFIQTEKALKEEAEKKIQGKKEMLDIIAHEFRTPLNVIGGYAQAFKGKVLGDVTEDQNNALNKMLMQTENLQHLVNSVLEITRVEAGELSVDQETINLHEYLEDLRCRYETPREGPVTLRWSFSSDLPAISSDRDKLTMILQNLINNALKFTDRGSVEVAAHESSDKKTVEFAITDTGIGISKEALPLIFEKFSQADRSSTRPYGGVGLGLYIVRVFTRIIGGSIAVQSEPHQGSTFTLSLPISRV
jgi:signal transduction histidine kinase